MRSLLPLIAMLLAGCSQPATQANIAPTVPATPPAVVRPRRVEAGPRPIPEIEHVMIVSIDGLRPDLALRAYMPRLRALCSGGSYTFWAETAPEAYTLPCHVTMLTGASPQKHGVTWNSYIEQSYPNVPTLFEVASQAGYSTAMATGKMKFIVFTRPGTLDYSYLPPDEPVSDHEVAVEAEHLLRSHRPDVLFVHLPDVDSAGHDFGWGSSEQIAAIEKADAALGFLLDTLADMQLTNSTLVIVTSDHGGANKGHAANDHRSHFIPWIVSGPKVRKDNDVCHLKIGIEDTYATACGMLGIDPGGGCTGKAVLDVFEKNEPAKSEPTHTNGPGDANP